MRQQVQQLHVLGEGQVRLDPVVGRAGGNHELPVGDGPVPDLPLGRGASGTLGGAVGTTGKDGVSLFQPRHQPGRGIRDQGSGHGTRRSSEPAARQPGTGPPPARRGEDVGMTQLDDVEPQRDERRRRTRSSKPRVQGPLRRTDGADTARRRDDCRQLRTTGRRARASLVAART